MPITINGRVYMNLQEAVAWLLKNNALPFQCKVNFVADTEISKTDIINPAPAELKIGSLVLFADGIVGTVNAVTTNGFKVGSEGTDLSDGVPHITGIQLDASQHLIFTMSEGDPIDAGLVKEISNFSIDASQHLVANYNDGTTQDLGAIFTGNVNIAGNFTANSIIENMSGYNYNRAYLDSRITLDYVGICKNGNKVTFVIAGKLVADSDIAQNSILNLGEFVVPNAVGAKLYPNYDTDKIGPNRLFLGISSTSGVDAMSYLRKWSNVSFNAYLVATQLLPIGTYYFRFEYTLLLSNNFAS